MTKYYTDGFCFESNPSKTGGGYTIVDENNKLIVNHKILKEGFTNNESELLGVYNTLLLSQSKDVISTDSKNTILWIESMKGVHENGKPKKKKRSRKDLDSIKLECYRLLISKEISLIWEPREMNLAGIYNENSGLDNGSLE